MDSLYFYLAGVALALFLAVCFLLPLVLRDSGFWDSGESGGDGDGC